MTKTLTLPSTLEFEDTMSTLDVDIATLRRTAGYELATGKMPKSRPVDHFEVIGGINKMLENEIGAENITTEPIHISKRHTARVGWDTSKMGIDAIVPLDKYLVKRAITRLNVIGSENNTKLNPSVSICYNELGIEVAFGVNNIVCANMTIMGSDKIYRTFGSGKTGYHDMMDKVKGYISDMSKWYKEDLRIIKELESNNLSNNLINEMVGELLESSVYGMKNPNDQILNCTQLNRLVEQKLKCAKHDGKNNAWDFVNWGTESLKAKGNDFITLNTANNKFHNYVIEKLSIN